MRNRQRKCNPDTASTGQVPDRKKMSGNIFYVGITPRHSRHFMFGTGSCTGQADTAHNAAHYSIVHCVHIAQSGLILKKLGNIAGCGYGKILF